MEAAPYFAQSYRDARETFLAQCDRAGAEVVTCQHPLRGPDGERLFTDIARLGPRDARKALLLISGTHGVEGFCGAGVQSAWLSSPQARELPPDVAVYLIHAINPHGFAWLRRVTEDGVDLCRNFVDFQAPLPFDPRYADIIDALVPPEWTGPVRDKADARLAEYVGEKGIQGAFAVIARGQYQYWYAPFFGGEAETWSNRLLRRFLRGLRGTVTHLACIDYHTGLGDYGAGQLLCFHAPRGAAHRRAVGWWGEACKSIFAGESIAYELTGGLLPAIEAELPEAEVTAAAYEFGTRPMPVCLDALRADHWLYAYGDLGTDFARHTRTQIRDAYYGDTEDWKQMIWEQGNWAQTQALDALARA